MGRFEGLRLTGCGMSAEADKLMIGIYPCTRGNTVHDVKARSYDISAIYNDLSNQDIIIEQ